MFAIRSDTASFSFHADTAAFAFAAPGGIGGGITSVTAGTGLTGAEVDGDVTLHIAVPLSLTGSSASGLIEGANTGTGYGLFGEHQGSGNWGAIGLDDRGVYGEDSVSGNWGLLGFADRGVYGEHNSTLNYGHLGSQSSGAYGRFVATGNWGRLGDTFFGVRGVNDSTTNVGALGTRFRGVYGKNANGNWGGIGSDAYGAFGLQETSGNWGFFGSSTSGAYGVHVVSGNWGTIGSSGGGVYGQYGTSNHYGRLGSSISGVYGQHGSSGTWGRIGTSLAGAEGTYTSGGHFGSLGDLFAGVYGDDGSGTYAGWFSGDVFVAGNLSKGSGSFVIDHPSDPMNRLLRHNFVESPENLLIYRGKAQLGGNGETTVEMPKYFRALTDEDASTVGLTSIGQPFQTGYQWDATHERFTIYGEPNREVSWVVYAERDEPVIHLLAKPTEEDKGPDNPLADRGELLFPTAYGYSASLGRDYPMRSQASVKPSEHREEREQPDVYEQHEKPVKQPELPKRLRLENR